MEEANLESLALFLKEILYRLKMAAHDPPFNLILKTAPIQEKNAFYHWHIEILPRLTITAGFEWGTGIFINPTPPELAAQSLREITDKEGSLCLKS